MAIQEISVTDRRPRKLTDTNHTRSEEVCTATVYRFEGITEVEAELLRIRGLTDPITQKSAVNENVLQELSNQIEIGYLPEVSDPDSHTLFKLAKFLGVNPSAVSTSTIYASNKSIDPSIIAHIIKQNETIITEKPTTLLIDRKPGPVEVIPITELSKEMLLELSNKRSLSLDENEMIVIQKYFRRVGREPTDIELEVIAQTWSEHNCHKTFKGILIDEEGNVYTPLITQLKKASEPYFEKVGVATAFKDNSGGLLIDDKWVFIGKVETHITPTGIEPYGANMTLFGGTIRDIIGTGKVGENQLGIVVLYFAPPDMNSNDIPEGALHPRYVLEKALQGQRDYGNPMGIPTSIFSLHFLPDFVGKPMAMGGNFGIIEKQYVEKGEPEVGDLVVSVGGKTGRDGVHGATVSSAAATNETLTKHATAVQLGDPIEEKKFADALKVCRDEGIISAITDCGGGGFSAAVGEIGEHTGVEINLAKAPLKYKGLSPWEIWLSESQERMIVAVKPQHINKFIEICKKFDVGADVIGRFTGDKKLTLKYEDKIVGQLDMDFLHNGLPQKVMRIQTPKIVKNLTVPTTPKTLEDYSEALLKNLSHINVCSKEDLHRKYDLTVQAKTALAPYTGVFQDTPNEAVVNCPVDGSRAGAVVAQGLHPHLSGIDPYWGTVWAYSQAASRFAAVGGNIDRAVIIDNFVAPVPSPEVMGKVHEEMKALVTMINTCETPGVSGKDSMSSTFKTKDKSTINIPPFVNITMMGVIPDVEKTVSADIKDTGSTLVLAGKMDTQHLGGSIYFQNQNIANCEIPKVDIQELPITLKSLHSAIQTGQVKSCKAIGEGGLAAALAQMCFGGDSGATIDVSDINASRPDFALFNETAGTFVVEVQDENTANALFGSIPHVVLGKTTKDKKITAKDHGNLILEAELDNLKRAWKEPMKGKIAA